MTWILLVSSIVFARPDQQPRVDLLQASYGIIGRDEIPIINADAAYQCTDNAQTAADWDRCGLLWSTSALDQPLQSDSDIAVMWSVVSYIRAANYASAYKELGILMPRAESIGWSVLVLESWLLHALGGNKESIAILKHYPEMQVDYIGAQIVLLESYQAKGKHRKAQKLIQEVIASGQADAWFWWWISHADNDRSRDDIFRQMIDSTNATVFHYQEAVRHFAFQGNLENALQIGLQGLNIFSKTEYLQKQLVELFSGQEKHFLTSKVIKIPEHVQAQELLGAIYLREKKYDKAEHHFSLAVQYGAVDERLFAELIEAQLAQGNARDGRQTTSLAVQQHPRNQKFWDLLWQLSETTEQKTEFLLSLEQAFLRKNYLPGPLLKKGFEVATKLQQQDKAILWAEREVLQSNSWRAWIRKAQAFERNGQEEQAIVAYEQALQLEPDNSFLLNNLAWLLIQAPQSQEKDLEKALGYAQKAVALARTPVAGFYDTWAAGLWRLDRPEEALDIQNKAVQLAPTNEQYQKTRDRYQERTLSQ